MTVHRAVRHLNNHLHDLRKARAEHKSDFKDLRQDKKELARDRAELKRDLRQGDKMHRALDVDRKQLQAAQAGKQAAIAQFEAQRQAIVDRYNGDGFEPAPGTTDPAMDAELAALDQQRSQVVGKFDARIAAERAEISGGKTDVLAKRAEIRRDRKEINHDKKVISNDRKELARDRADIRSDRRAALKDLRQAEYHMGLKATNRARRELGLNAVDHVIRPVGPGHVSGTMRRLASAARSAAMSMGGYDSQGLCATGVAKAIRNSMGLAVYGNGNQIDNNLPRNHFKQVNIPLAQALKIPGCVLTWEHTSTSLGRIYGHTAITLGDGHSSASDFIESNTFAGNASRTGLKIFMPTR